MAKTLADLLAALPAADLLAVQGDAGAAVSAGVVEDSRAVRRGAVFVARRGQQSDGHRYIAAAIAAGASAVIGEAALDDLPLPYVRVKDAAQALGLLASAYYDYPARELVIVGVTGTDGKTTTCHLLHSILKCAGIAAGSISTLAADFGDEAVATGLHVTTPGAPQVQGYLARMRAAGLTHCILEMTSHGLAQGRLQGVDVDVAVLTNLMHEHLDFHGSWENYRAAKARMFHMLGAGFRKAGVVKAAVVNADDPSAGYFQAIPAERSLCYGLHQRADFQARDIRHLPQATAFTVQGEPLEMRLVGEFNLSNALAAVSAARHLGVGWGAVRRGLLALDGLAGRMERVDEGQDFIALVDFAHTPNALKRALSAARRMLSEGGRLIAVFGSAGLRDVEKRRLMAETSAVLADMTILTAEDPRTESLDAILAAMAAGCRAQGGVEGATFVRIRDRGEALYRACQMARAGDVVIACGKGHEQSMCFGTVEYAWDDRAALRAALRGSALATLPTAAR